MIPPPVIGGCIWRIVAHIGVNMTVKKMALNTLEQLPDDVTFDGINKRLEVMAAIQKGLDSLDNAAGKSIDEVEKVMASWTAK